MSNIHIETILLEKEKLFNKIDKLKIIIFTILEELKLLELDIKRLEILEREYWFNFPTDLLYLKMIYAITN
jgi:hypothetical protein